MGHVKSKDNENGGGIKEWICDSGVEHHMTGDKTLFEKLRELQHLKKAPILVNEWIQLLQRQPMRP